MKQFILFIILSFFSINVKANDEITYDKLWEFLVESEIKFPEVVFAQAILESGHFKSTIFKRNKNLFGMKVPKTRDKLTVGEAYGYAKFSDWQQSVLDYRIWQSNFIEKHKIETQPQYLKALDRRYSETRNYSSLLIKIIKKFSLT